MPSGCWAQGGSPWRTLPVNTEFELESAIQLQNTFTLLARTL